jgi:ATP-binding cassette subfamily C exporter for protease/lipase
MKPQTPPSELALAFEPFKPVLMRAAGFSMIISLLALSPTVYMLEVYERVVNARSGMTLAMLTVVVVLCYAVMEILEKVRGAMMRAAGVQLDEKLSERVYNAMCRAVRRCSTI